MQLQKVLDSLVSGRRELIDQRDNKLKQVTHLAQMVGDLKLQLESLVRQDQYKTQQYGIHRDTHLLRVCLERRQIGLVKHTSSTQPAFTPLSSQMSTGLVDPRVWLGWVKIFVNHGVSRRKFKKFWNIYPLI